MSVFDTMTPEQIRAHRENVLLRLLIRVNQIETSELTHRLQEHGHADVQTSYIRLLGNTDTEGTRLVVLAQRIGVSRQAASQMVAEIERRGYVERAADPTDGRAILIRHTPAGRTLLRDALAEMADIESGYERIIGTDAMATVKHALRAIAEATDPATALGR